VTDVAPCATLRVVAGKRPPPRGRAGLLGWLRIHVIATRVDALLAVALVGLAVYALPRLFRWAILDSVFLSDTPSVCRDALGACWAIISSHARVMFFGLYPFDEQWRAVCALTAVLGALVATFVVGPLRLRPIACIWIATALVFVGFMGGGLPGLAPVSSDKWSGLPLTIFVFLGTVVLGFPVAIALALGRAGSLPAIRLFCTLVIEIVRSVPLLTILFCAAVVAPLLVPGWFNPTKTYRVILAMALFYACYQAEVVRGGLQGVPKGQSEAALSLGLTRGKTVMLVLLPQALRITIPATINLVVVALKDTSMIVVVGLFDFLASANTSISSDAWAPFFGEVYLVVAGTFLALTSALAALGRRADRRPALGD
jgi:general L-amino acid transport system permease protein